MEAIEIRKYKAAVILARGERLWVDERPNKRALVDEKWYAIKNEMQPMRYGDEITSDQKWIENVLAQPYRKPFREKKLAELAFRTHF